jgi:hypothetical protein
MTSSEFEELRRQMTELRSGLMSAAAFRVTTKPVSLDGNGDLNLIGLTPYKKPIADSSLRVSPPILLLANGSQPDLYDGLFYRDQIISVLEAEFKRRTHWFRLVSKLEADGII